VGNLHRIDGRPRQGSLTIRLKPWSGWTRWIVFGVLANPAAAQTDSAPHSVAALAPQPVFFAPIYEGGVLKNRGLSIPVNLRLVAERRISVGYTASNSYLNPGFLDCRDSSCRLRYETDHTGNLYFLDFSQPVLEAWEFTFGVGAYRMGAVARWSPIHLLASDRVLRAFHEDLLGEESLPLLSGAADDRQIFSLTDFAGRNLTLVPEHSYALPLRLDLTRYVQLRTTPQVRMGLNVGMHLSYPVEGSFSRNTEFGLSANFIHSLRITENVASTFHVQVARFKTDVQLRNPNSPVDGDDSSRSQYALTYGLRFANTFSGKAPCSFSMSQVTNSAHYDKNTYWTWDPLVFEGGGNLRSALAAANDYGVLSYACEYRQRQFQVSLVEDIGGFSQILDADGAGPSYDPDFAVSVAVSWVLGAQRRDTPD
jgi:hypothetical protein